MVAFPVDWLVVNGDAWAGAGVAMSNDFVFAADDRERFAVGQSFVGCKYYAPLDRLVHFDEDDLAFVAVDLES